MTKTEAEIIEASNERTAKRLAEKKRIDRIAKQQNIHLVKLWQATDGDGQTFLFDKVYHYVNVVNAEILQIRTVYSTLALDSTRGTVTYNHYPDLNCGQNPTITVPTSHLFATVARAAEFGKYLLETATANSVTNMVNKMRLAMDAHALTEKDLSKLITQFEKLMGQEKQ